MAKFSQTFLQSLLQPSYQEGLFTAARGIGQAPALRMQQQQQQAEQQQLAAMDPTQRFNFAIDKLNKAGKYDEAARLTASRDQYTFNQTERAAKIQVRDDKKIIDFVSNGMLANQQTEVPTTLKVGEEEIVIPPRLRDDILKEANLKREQQESAAASKSAMELTGYYADYVNNNPDLLEKVPSLQQHIDTLNSMEPKSTFERKAAVSAVVKAVDADQKQKTDAMYSDEEYDRQARIITEDLINAGSNTHFWQDWMGNRDIHDFLTGSGTEDEVEVFQEQMALGIKQGIKSKTELIDFAMSGMRRKIKGQEQSEAIDENERMRQQLFDSIVKDLMDEQGLTLEQAESQARILTGAGPIDPNLVAGGGGIALY